jgi:aldehyde:ferredoxin oxidoreductase
VEYETIGLMGTNCGLSDPDELAHVNYIANDLGIDTIETGAMIGVLMEAGVGKFGDVGFIVDVLEAIRQGTEDGKLWSQGTARVGAHYKVARVPVIKKQAISAYDPRVVEVTGITMMLTAQGADHTAGNVPRFDCTDKSIEQIVEASFDSQVATAAADSLGLCIFGRTVTMAELALITNAINDAHDTHLDPDFFFQLGREALKLEAEFNKAAGFNDSDDELPAFFYDEALQPTGKRARFHSDEVNRAYAEKSASI